MSQITLVEQILWLVILEIFVFTIIFILSIQSYQLMVSTCCHLMIHSPPHVSIQNSFQPCITSLLYVSENAIGERENMREEGRKLVERRRMGETWILSSSLHHHLISSSSSIYSSISKVDSS